MENHENKKFFVESLDETTKEEGNDNDDNRRQTNSSKLSDFFRTFQHHESLSMLYIDEVTTQNPKCVFEKIDKQHHENKVSVLFYFTGDCELNCQCYVPLVSNIIMIKKFRNSLGVHFLSSPTRTFIYL